MIALFTDFGIEGPYVGQMKAVLAAAAPGVPVIDLMHDAPAHDPRRAAYLLAALIDVLPEKAVFCAVVDPGVGGARLPVVMRADKRWYVGPGNGLFELVRRRARAASTWRLASLPMRPAATFHGRDLFAPAAAELALGRDVPKEPLLGSLPGGDWPDELAEIIYVDRYGNAMTGLRAAGVQQNSVVELAGKTLRRARTFSDVPHGEPFWYENSVGLVEIAVNRGSAGLGLGAKLAVKAATP